MVSKEQIGSIENLVRTLNPAAKIIRTTYSKVDLKELLSERSPPSLNIGSLTDYLSLKQIPKLSTLRKPPQVPDGFNR